MLRSVALPTGINLYVTGNNSQSIVINEFARGIQSSGAYIAPINLNAPISESANNIKNATFVIAYIGNNAISSRLYVEIGIAAAHKKIIYIVSNNNNYDVTLDSLQYKHINYVSNITIVD
jgi:hypothetical protein